MPSTQTHGRIGLAAGTQPASARAERRNLFINHELARRRGADGRPGLVANGGPAAKNRFFSTEIAPSATPFFRRNSTTASGKNGDESPKRLLVEYLHPQNSRFLRFSSRILADHH